MLTIKRWLHHDVSERGRGHPLLAGLRQLVSRLHHRSPETQAKSSFYLTVNAKSSFYSTINAKSSFYSTVNAKNSFYSTVNAKCFSLIQQTQAKSSFYLTVNRTKDRKKLFLTMYYVHKVDSDLQIN
jgi:hypothetical protein